MKRIAIFLLITLVMMFAQSICLAESVPNKPRVGFMIGKKAMEDKDLDREIEKCLHTKFDNNPNYEYVPYASLRMKLVDFRDNYNIVNRGLNRKELFEFAQEQNLDYIVQLVFYGQNAVFYTDRFGVNCNMEAILSARVIDINTKKTIFSDNFTENAGGINPPDAMKSVLPKLINKFSASLNVDFKPATKIDAQDN